MTNYLLVYVGGGTMPAGEAEQQAEIQAWDVWFKKLGSSLVDGGNPFTPVAKSIASDGKVTVIPAGSMATGYSVIKADSLDAAIALAKGCPVLRSGSTVSVYETFDPMA